jgi:hypothetical protein
MATVELKPVGVIKARLGITPDGKVQRKFQSLCQEYMDKYVPMTPGGRADLRKTLDMSDPTKIVYEMKYAHYQYEGVLWVMDNGKAAYYNPEYGFWSKKPKHPTNIALNYNTPGTGDHWDERMKSAEMDKLVEDLQKFVDRGGK